MKTIKHFLKNNIHWLIVIAVSLLCFGFVLLGTPNENGYITLDGSDAKIEESTKEFVEDSLKAFNRITNENRPTDDATEKLNDKNEVGLGFYTSIDAIISRRLPDGDNDGGRGWQCSKYTAYLATGKREYSTKNPDYGPVNGKDVASWLVKNYGFKYIDKPIAGAIGSGEFNTRYGHTVMYLYSTGANTAMVNDANYTPLKVSTHNMNISGWKWVVPGNYNANANNNGSNANKPATTNKPTTNASNNAKASVNAYVVKKGDTLGAIAYKMGWYSGGKLYGDDGYAQALAEENNIAWRGLIYPGQVIKRK
jgi:hypothetical protein